MKKSIYLLLVPYMFLVTFLCGCDDKENKYKAIGIDQNTLNDISNEAKSFKAQYTEPEVHGFVTVDKRNLKISVEKLKHVFENLKKEKGYKQENAVYEKVFFDNLMAEIPDSNIIRKAGLEYIKGDPLYIEIKNDIEAFKKNNLYNKVIGGVRGLRKMLQNGIYDKQFLKDQLSPTFKTLREDVMFKQKLKFQIDSDIDRILQDIFSYVSKKDMKGNYYKLKQQPVLTKDAITGEKVYMNDDVIGCNGEEERLDWNVIEENMRPNRQALSNNGSMTSRISVLDHMLYRYRMLIKDMGVFTTEDKEYLGIGVGGQKKGHNLTKGAALKFIIHKFAEVLKEKKGNILSILPDKSVGYDWRGKTDEGLKGFVDWILELVTKFTGGEKGGEALRKHSQKLPKVSDIFDKVIAMMDCDFRSIEKYTSLKPVDRESEGYKNIISPIENLLTSLVGKNMLGKITKLLGLFLANLDLFKSHAIEKLFKEVLPKMTSGNFMVELGLKMASGGEDAVIACIIDKINVVDIVKEVVNKKENFYTVLSIFIECYTSASFSSIYDEFKSSIGMHLEFKKNIGHCAKNMMFLVYVLIFYDNDKTAGVLQGMTEYMNIFFYASNYYQDVVVCYCNFAKNYIIGHLADKVEAGSFVHNYAKELLGSLFDLLPVLFYGKDYASMNVYNNESDDGMEDGENNDIDIVGVQCYHDNLKSRNWKEMVSERKNNNINIGVERLFDDKNDVSKDRTYNSLVIKKAKNNKYSITINGDIVIDTAREIEGQHHKKVQFYINDNDVVETIKKYKTRVSFDDGVTPEKYILAFVVKPKSNVLIYCEDGSSVSVSDESMSYYGLFQDNTALDIKILGSGSEIKNMNSMFRDCKSLKNLDLSNLLTDNVTDVGYMFSGCSSLVFLDFSNLSVANMHNEFKMFDGVNKNGEIRICCNGEAWKYLINGQYKKVEKKEEEKEGLEEEAEAGGVQVIVTYPVQYSSQYLTVEIAGNSNINEKMNGNKKIEFINKDYKKSGKNFEKNTITDPDINNRVRKNHISPSVEHYVFLCEYDNNNESHKALRDSLLDKKCKVSVKNLDWEQNNNEEDGVFYVADEDVCYLFALVALDIKLSGGGTMHKEYFVYCPNADNKANRDGEFYGLFQGSEATEIEILSCGNRLWDMRGMFFQCINLKKLDLGNLITNRVEYMSYMFSKCSSLKELDLSKLEISNVRNMSDIFEGCSSLESLNLSNWNTRNVTNMKNMFANCTSLESLDLSNFNTSEVTNMSGMFSGCSSLKSLNLSNWNTEKVDNMGCMFQDCTGLTSLDLSSFDPSSCNDVGYMFSGCSKLVLLNLSRFNNLWSNYVNTYNMFDGVMPNRNAIEYNFILNKSIIKAFTDYCGDCNLELEYNANDEVIVWYAKSVVGADKVVISPVEDHDRMLSCWLCFNGINDFRNYISERNGDIVYNVVINGNEVKYDPMFFDGDEDYGYVKPKLLEKVLTTLLLKNFYCNRSKDRGYSDIRQHLKEDVGICLNMIKLVDDYDINALPYDEYLTMLLYMMRKEIGRYGTCNNVPMYNPEQVVGGYYQPNSLADEKGEDEDVKDGGEGYIGEVSAGGKVTTPEVKCKDTKDVQVVLQGTRYTLQHPGNIQQEDNRDFVNYDVCNSNFIDDVRVYGIDQNLYRRFKGLVYNKNEEFSVKVFDESGSTSYILAIVLMRDTYSGKDYYNLFYCRYANSVPLAAGQIAYIINSVADKAGVFFCNDSIVEFILLDSGKDLSSVEKMFAVCPNLEEVDFSRCKAIAITDMFCMLAFCGKLKRVDLSHLATCKYNMSQAVDVGLQFVNHKPDSFYFGITLICPMDFLYSFFMACCRNVPSSILEPSKIDADLYQYNKNYIQYKYTENKNKVYNVKLKIRETTEFDALLYTGTRLIFHMQSSTKLAEYFLKCKEKIESDRWHEVFYKISDMDVAYNSNDEGISSVVFDTTVGTSDECLFSVKVSDQKELVPIANMERCPFINSQKLSDVCKQSIYFKGVTLYVAGIDKEHLGDIQYLIDNKVDYFIKYKDKNNNPDKYACFDNTDEGFIVAFVTVDKSLSGFSIKNNKHGNMAHVLCFYRISSNDCKHKGLFDIFLDKNMVMKIEIIGCSDGVALSGEKLFAGFGNLQELDVKRLSTSKVTDMRNMFQDCSSLTSLNLSNFKTDNVTDMSWMFGGCNSLTSLDLKNFNTNQVNNMSYMFSDCKSLTSLDVSNFKTDNVTDMRNIFSNCSSLTSLNLSNWNLYEVKQNFMDRMFYNCSNLLTLHVGFLPYKNGEGNNPYSQKQVFSGCKDVLMIIGKGGNVYHGENEFLDRKEGQGYVLDNNNNGISVDTVILRCEVKSLYNKSVKEYNFIYNSDGREKSQKCNEYKGGYFSGADKIDILNKDALLGCVRRNDFFYVDLGDDSEPINNNDFVDFLKKKPELKLFYSDQKNSTEKKPIPDYVFALCCASVSAMGSQRYFLVLCFGAVGLFYNCDSLVNVEILNCGSGITDMSRMFCCENLQVIKFINVNTKNVTNMSWMFCDSSIEGCLKTIEGLEKFNTSKVRDMSYMFNNCKRLKEIDVSTFDTKNVLYMDSIFYCCSGLEKLDLSNFSTRSIVSMDHMFFGTEVSAMLDLSSFNVSQTYYIMEDHDSLPDVKSINNDAYDIQKGGQKGVLLNDTFVDHIGSQYGKDGKDVNYFKIAPQAIKSYNVDPAVGFDLGTNIGFALGTNMGFALGTNIGGNMLECYYNYYDYMNVNGKGVLSGVLSFFLNKNKKKTVSRELYEKSKPRYMMSRRDFLDKSFLVWLFLVRSGNWNIYHDVVLEGFDIDKIK